LRTVIVPHTWQGGASAWFKNVWRDSGGGGGVAVAAFSSSSCASA